MSDNPLLHDHKLPPFSMIQPQHVLPAMQQLINDNKTNIARLLEQFQGDGSLSASWDNLIMPMDEWETRLNNAWSPVGHLNSVMNNDELREAYNACLPLLTEYGTELGQNKQLYQAYQQIKDSDDYANLSTAQQKVINNGLRDFHLSGVDLSDDDKARFTTLKKKLSELTNKFSENVLDATQGWTKHVTDKAELLGLPDTALAGAEQAAKNKDLDGYLITLEFPSYMPLMTYCDSSVLRREVYEAFCTRASDQGPNVGQWDNSQLMLDIVQVRQQIAELLGFKHHAEKSLATKMAENPEQVIRFLEELAEKSKPVAEQEFAELKQFAFDTFGVSNLNAWDVGYYSEKLRQQKYAISQEELRPYFPAEKVISGMFATVQKLYGVQCEQVDDIDSYHPDLRFYQIRRNGEHIASFYLDPFARANKRGGAWMDDCRVRRTCDDGSLQLPVAYLVCNFTPPIGDQPALLTHNEVTTLFHEFGHGLHHMLTKIDCSSVSGINGVAWDAVELPSQFMENWCWEKQALMLFSSHHETGEPLPESLLNKMLAAKNFQSGMMMMRQLEFSLFDFKLHMLGQAKTDIQQVISTVREQVSVVPVPEFNRFQHSFSHIFAGGYSAGYYSYKWAEVLSADAFSTFEQNGIFDQATAQRFLTNILEKGGSEDAMALFVAFQGREPSTEALLRHSGISQSEVA